MNIRLGTDIVHVPRIQAAVERFGDRFLQRVYTATEQQDCAIVNPHQGHSLRMVSLAGRWAAKEAVTKALGTGWRGIGYTDIEVCRHPDGVPYIHLYRNAAAKAAQWGACQWQLSLSHDGDYAIATVLMTCLPQ